MRGRSRPKRSSLAGQRGGSPRTAAWGPQFDSPQGEGLKVDSGADNGLTALAVSVLIAAVEVTNKGLLSLTPARPVFVLTRLAVAVSV